MITTTVGWMESVKPGIWRGVALAYFIALTTGTHWPSLRIGAPGPIPLDKILHALAFCGLAGLLMLARIADRSACRAFSARNIWRSALLALILGAIDELTQALPGQDRFPGWPDFAANTVGIAIALAVAMLVFRPASGARTNP
ncbi:MAG: hypothetical protein IT430_04975 [Phycisphaerales bacterium]|nr:hypothetical protein [Phycisphaerales bacterium]